VSRWRVSRSIGTLEGGGRMTIVRQRGRRATRFVKLEGAGNDFVLVDHRSKGGRNPGLPEIRWLLDRHRGVGGDGLLLLLSPTEGNDVEVRYWNAAGEPAGFCGNGARCVAHHLFSTEPSKETLRFRLGRVEVEAKRSRDGRIDIRHPMPRFLTVPQQGPRVPAGVNPVWIDSGVPHWLLPVRAVDAFDLGTWGPMIRSHPSLGPRGTNVDAIEIGPEWIRVRSWERGVEGETQACGSGLLAAAFWAWRVLGRDFPLELRSRSGDRFEASLAENETGIWLEGPARTVFTGCVDF